ncbi:MAG: hypothetical protein GF308_17300 [Candidatus Heimdallarchaeota archaeon]|nr:hypothetical protein [Candidatus Heimdallarchaeota archaeon]
MNYGFFTGCTSQADSYENELSARAVLKYFSLNFADIKDQSCCGTPIKSTRFKMWVYLAARIHALAGKQNFDAIATICNGCDRSLSELSYELEANPDLKELVNDALSKEHLQLEQPLPVRNILTILYEDVGLEQIRKSVKQPFNGIKIATHYGCHILRPKTVERPVDAEKPRKMQEILEVLGAQSPDYPELLDCCAATIIGIEPEKAMATSGDKIEILKKRGYQGISNICPFCHKQLGASQDVIGKLLGKKLQIPALYLAQYIGLAIGLDEESLGLHLNLTGWEELLNGGTAGTSFE